MPAKLGLGNEDGKAAGYAKSPTFDTVTLAVFIPVEDEAVLSTLSVTEVIDGVRVVMVAIRW
ncbi:MAG: hypothetical protein B6245_05045 [Desulfobacteraceae bacterium 4572_88]|nr:MAG: hypothetical protein B6245_05045 [Desulfobacteraceae bacterium 4572_88]